MPIKIPNHKAKFISCSARNDLENCVWMCGANKGISDQQGNIIGTPQRITRVHYQGQIIDIDFRVKEVFCGDNVILFIDWEENLWVVGRDEDLNIDCEVPTLVPHIKAERII